MLFLLSSSALSLMASFPALLRPLWLVLSVLASTGPALRSVNVQRGADGGERAATCPSDLYKEPLES